MSGWLSATRTTCQWTPASEPSGYAGEGVAAERQKSKDMPWGVDWRSQPDVAAPPYSCACSSRARGHACGNFASVIAVFGPACLPACPSACCRHMLNVLSSFVGSMDAHHVQHVPLLGQYSQQVRGSTLRYATAQLASWRCLSMLMHPQKHSGIAALHAPNLVAMQLLPYWCPACRCAV